VNRPTRFLSHVIFLAVLLSALIFQPHRVAAQKPAIDPNGESLADAVEAIHHARVATRVLFITAHPDDEASSVVTYLSRGAGDELAMLTITRGQGGQNAIGPEQGDQLGVIRSAELFAAAQTYGAKLYFSRAPDFGYSKTLEETLHVWGDTAEDDMVRVIRAFKPEIVINGWAGVRGGHGNHQASGMLTPKAVEAAGDPKAFTAQFSEGLKPWHVDLLVQSDRSGANSGGVSLPVNEVSPLRGETYSEIARDGFVNQRSQGVVAFQNSPFLRRPATITRSDGAALEATDIAEPITWLAARFPAYADILRPALTATAESLDRANAAALALDWARAASELARAGSTIQTLQTQVGSRGGEDSDAEYELARVRAHIDRALTIATAIHINAQSDRSNLVIGEPFNVRVDVEHRQGFADSAFAVPKVIVPDCWQVAPPSSAGNGQLSFKVFSPPAEVSSCTTRGTPTDRLIPDEMLPFPHALIITQVNTTIDGYSFDSSADVFSQHANATTVTTESLRVVPTVSLTLEPEQFIIPEGRNALESAKPLDVLLRAHSYSDAAAQITIGLDVPSGWKISAPQNVQLEAGGDALQRFVVTPPAGLAAGTFELKAWAKRGAQEFRESLAPLPSLPSYLWTKPATLPVHAFAIDVPANLHVGYIAADIDPVPAALGRVGVQVDMIDPATLAFGDLRRFDAIIVGIRAYELRSDVLANNHRLLDYVTAGGTLLVEYERSNIWDDLKPKPSPYDATMGSTIRITDENSPVRFIDANSPLLNFPNKITMDDFNGWVQERGNYFWSKWDSHYQAVLAMKDPGENEETGGLVWTHFGKGIYIYSGIEFFRQLPEGNAGAFRLFVNLLSQSRAK
jgi:LmbE family N-acetylglucosaminyl deacetylase